MHVLLNLVKLRRKITQNTGRKYIGSISAVSRVRSWISAGSLSQTAAGTFLIHVFKTAPEKLPAYLVD